MKNLIDDIQKAYSEFCDKEYIFHLENDLKINLKCKVENLPHLIGIHKLKDDCKFIRQLLDKNDYNITTKNIFKVLNENEIGYKEFQKYNSWTIHLQMRMENFTYEKLDRILRKTTMFSFIFDKAKIKNSKARYVLIDKKDNLFLQLYIGYDKKFNYYYPNSYVADKNKDSNLARESLKIIKTEIFNLSTDGKKMIEIIEHAKIREIKEMIKIYNNKNIKFYKAVKNNEESLKLLNEVNFMAREIIKKYKSEITSIDEELSNKLEIFLKK
ncbi:MAG: hypothetical protein ACRDD2_03860 [Sarcina sp.]